MIDFGQLEFSGNLVGGFLAILDVGIGIKASMQFFNGVLVQEGGVRQLFKGKLVVVDSDRLFSGTFIGIGSLDNFS